MPTRRRDRGTTFVEILVSIVLLGTAVGGTLTALRTTIVSSERDAGQAKAQSWMVAAADAVHRTPYMSCDTFDVGAVKNAYDLAVQSAPPPEGWAVGGSVGVNIVYFWSKADGQEIWGTACGSPLSSQLVEIYVRSPTGDIVRTMQVIKRGG